MTQPPAPDQPERWWNEPTRQGEPAPDAAAPIGARRRWFRKPWGAREVIPLIILGVFFVPVLGLLIQKQGAGYAPAGSTVRDGDLQFTVTKLAEGREIDDGVVAQGNYFVVYLRVKNVGQRAEVFSGRNQRLLDAGGAEYRADTTAALHLDDSRSVREEINPGNEVAVAVVFDVPTAAQPAAIELHESNSSRGVTLRL